MKKIIGILLAISMLLSLSACASKDNGVAITEQGATVEKVTQNYSKIDNGVLYIGIVADQEGSYDYNIGNSEIIKCTSAKHGNESYVATLEGIISGETYFSITCFEEGTTNPIYTNAWKIKTNDGGIISEVYEVKDLIEYDEESDWCFVDGNEMTVNVYVENHDFTLSTCYASNETLAVTAERKTVGSGNFISLQSTLKAKSDGENVVRIVCSDGTTPLEVMSIPVTVTGGNIVVDK